MQKSEAAIIARMKQFLSSPNASAGLSVSLSKIVSQIAQFVVFVFAARVLSPTEFGVFAVTSSVAILLVRLADAGWREFIMSSQSTRAVDQAMTAALLASGLCSLLCLAISAIAASTFEAVEAGSLLALFAVWLPLASISAVHSGMLVRRGRLTALSVIQIMSEAVGLVTTLAELQSGSAVFALVYGRLASQTVCLVFVVTLTRWFPAISLDRAIAVELVEFSRHILASRLISFFRAYAATLSVGLFLGPASAGYFRAGERIVLALSEVLAETFQTMGWVRFRRAVAEGPGGEATRSSLRREANFLHPILLAASAPVFVGLAIVSDNLVEAAFGPAWKPAALVVTLIALRQLLVMPSFLSEPLLATAGEIRRMPPISAMNAVLSIAMVMVAAPFGIIAVAVGQLAVACVSLSTAIWLQRRYVGISLAEIASRSGFILPATAALAAAVLTCGTLARNAGLAAPTTLAIQVVVGAAVYGFSVLLLQRFMREGWRLLARPLPTYS